MDPRHPSEHGNRVVQTEDGNRVVEPATQAEVDRRRAGQARQMDDLGGTPTTPTLPGSMASGMLKGSLVGAIVGAILLTPLAFAPILELSLMAKLVIVWIAGAAAGATIGAVFFAGAKAEAHNPENREYVYADGVDGDRQDGPTLH